MMKSVPKAIKPDWEELDRHAPWSCVSSAQLAKLLGVTVYDINRYKLLGWIEPEPRSGFIGRGNKRFYEVAKIRSLLEARTPSDITWDWVRRTLKGYKEDTLQTAISVIEKYYDIYEVHKPILPRMRK